MPVASTFAVTCVEPSVPLQIEQSPLVRDKDKAEEQDTHALKLVMVAANEPFVAAFTAVDESMVCAMLMLPQGFAVEGRWTSFLAGVPWTPRAGEMAAWA